MEVEIATVVWGIGSVTLASIDGELWSTHRLDPGTQCGKSGYWVGCGSSVSPMLF